MADHTSKTRFVEFGPFPLSRLVMDTPRRRHGRPRKKAREIDYVYAISQIGGLFLAFARAYPTIEASSAITDNRS